MIKRTTNINRPGARAPKLRPAAQPGWYKRFRQLAALANKGFKVK